MASRTPPFGSTSAARRVPTRARFGCWRELWRSRPESLWPRSGHSLAQQIEALRQYAANEGYEVLEEVSDPGQSGASLERPGMDRVRDLVAAGGVSVVLAQDRDRFVREPAYHYLLRREFEEHGTKIRALNDRGDESPEGESRGPRRLSVPAGASSRRPERARSSRVPQ